MNRICVEDIVHLLTATRSEGKVRICMLLTTENSFGDEVYFEFPLNKVPIDIAMTEVISIDNPEWFFTPGPLCINILEEKYPGGYKTFYRAYKKHMI